MKRITIEKTTHRNLPVLSIRFERDPQIEGALKKLDGMKWSQTMRCWYIKNRPENFRAALKILRLYGHVDFSSVINKVKPATEGWLAPAVKEKKAVQHEPLTEVHSALVDKFTQYLRSKRYSSNTTKTYTDALRTFLRFYSNKMTEHITTDDIIYFNNEYILKNRLSYAYQNRL